MGASRIGDRVQLVQGFLPCVGGALFNGQSPRYQSTFASCFNLAINSSTESTRVPAARLGGLTMKSTVVRGRTATLSSSQVRISIGLRRALIKPGSETRSEERRVGQG